MVVNMDSSHLTYIAPVAEVEELSEGGGELTLSQLLDNFAFGRIRVGVIRLIALHYHMTFYGA